MNKEDIQLKIVELRDEMKKFDVKAMPNKLMQISEEDFRMKFDIRDPEPFSVHSLQSPDGNFIEVMQGVEFFKGEEKITNEEFEKCREIQLAVRKEIDKLYHDSWEM